MKMTDDQKWAVNHYLDQTKHYNKRITKEVGRTIVMALGAAWMGYHGYQIIYNSVYFTQAPELQDVQGLKQAKETIASYTGTAPETALTEALTLVEKSHEANPGSFYDLDFLGIEQHIPYYIEDVAGMTDPKEYQPALKGIVTEISDLAMEESNQEAGIAMAAIGILYMGGFGSLFTVGGYKSLQDVIKLAKEKKEFQDKWR